MVTIDEVSKSDYDGLTTSEKEDIRQEVRYLSSTGWTQLSDGRLDRAIKDAIGERDSIYSGRMSRTPTLEGDAETFTLNLAAHKAELVEGGEANSESGEGGSVSYNSGQIEQYLSLTRYGKTCLRYVGFDESTSIVRSY